jgi:hypothetical protein
VPIGGMQVPVGDRARLDGPATVRISTATPATPEMMWLLVGQCFYP